MKLKNISLVLLFTMIFAVIHSQVASAQLTPGELAKVWQGMADYTVEVAKKMPAEHYDFTPVEVTRTFANQMLHFVEANYGLGNLMKFEGGIAPSAKGKEAIIKQMEDSFAFMKKSIANMSSSDLNKEIDWIDGTKKTLRRAILSATDHMAHTRGITIMYLRAKGIAPPNYRGW